jgi:AraC-like DNA-binding protein
MTMVQANLTNQLDSDYARVERALAFLHENYQRQPTLEEIAASISLSEYHFQRLFSRWVGISPKRFLQFLTKEHAKELLSGRLTCSAWRTSPAYPDRAGCTICSSTARLSHPENTRPRVLG